MVLDRPVQFNEADLNFSNAAPSRTLSEGNVTPPPSRGFKPDNRSNFLRFGFKAEHR